VKLYIVTSDYDGLRIEGTFLSQIEARNWISNNFGEDDQECFIQEEELYIPTPAAGEWEGVGALVEGAGSYLFTNTKGSNAIHLLYLQEGDDFLFDDNGNRFSFARLREYYTHFARINLPGTQKE